MRTVPGIAFHSLANPGEDHMKPSHLTTPRAMRDGVWISGADAIEKHEGRDHWLPTSFAWLLVFAAVVVLMEKLLPTG